MKDEKQIKSMLFDYLLLSMVFRQPKRGYKKGYADGFKDALDWALKGE